MDWTTFITSVVASGLIVGLLGWLLERRRFRHQQAMDIWGLTQQSYEKQIEALDKAGASAAANRIRLEYAGQQAAWRAQQGVTALAPRQVGPEGGTSLTDRQVEQLQQLLAASSSLNPGALSAEDYFRRGNSHYLAGRHQEALADYNRSLELRPDDPGTLNNRGISLRNLGRHPEALADYQRALELRPDHPDTLNNRGNALGELGRHQEALADYNRALELSPDDPGALNNRGIALGNLGRHQEALDDLNRALELRPDHPDTPYNMACLFSQTQRFQEALDWLARAIDIDPKNRSMAAQDPDFAPALGHPQFGPQFRQLVGEEGGESGEPKSPLVPL